MTDDPLRRTLIAENRAIQYDPEDRTLRELARYPTVRQPNTQPAGVCRSPAVKTVRCGSSTRDEAQEPRRGKNNRLS